MSDDCPVPLAPDTTNCSSRGIGCTDGECICADGWTGRGDFVSGSPACQLNIAGVRACWGFVLVAHTINFFVCLWFISSRPRKGVWYNDYGFRACITGLLNAACMSALGFIRVTDPTRTIGTDPAASFFFAFGACCFWTEVPLLSWILVRLMKNGFKGRNAAEARKVNFLYTSLRRFSPVLWFFSMVACLAPLFILIDPKNPSLMYGLAATHFVILAAVMIAYATVSETVVAPLVKELRTSLASFYDTRVESIEWKLSRYRAEVRNQVLFQMSSAAIFGLWPYAQRYSSYEVPLAWLGVAPLIAFGIYVIVPTKLKGSSTTDPSNLTAHSNPVVPSRINSSSPQ